MEPSHKNVHWDSEDQLLKLDFSDQLGYPITFYISGWDAGFNWWSVFGIDETRESIAFYESPGLDLYNEQCIPEVIAWKKTIPQRLQAKLFHPSHEKLLIAKLCHMNPFAEDLIKTNPLLLWLVLDYCKKHNPSEELIKEILKKKQKDIMASIGLIGSKSSVRILKKIEVATINDRVLRIISNIFSNDTIIKSLTHYPYIPYTMLESLSKYPWIAGQPIHRLLLSQTDYTAANEIHQLFNDSISLCNHFTENPLILLGPCNSIHALTHIHDTLVERMNNERQTNRNRSHLPGLRNDHGELLPLPAPPIPGNHCIKPVLKPKAVIKEGRQMQHCVATYLERIQRGKYYIYHMNQPENITIGLTITAGNIIKIDQIKGVKNKKPSDEANQIIHSWFREFLRK